MKVKSMEARVPNHSFDEESGQWCDLIDAVQARLIDGTWYTDSFDLSLNYEPEEEDNELWISLIVSLSIDFEDVHAFNIHLKNTVPSTQFINVESIKIPSFGRKLTITVFQGNRVLNSIENDLIDVTSTRVPK